MHINFSCFWKSKAPTWTNPQLQNLAFPESHIELVELYVNVHTLLCIPLTYTNVCWCILYKKQRSNHGWYIEDLWFFDVFCLCIYNIQSFWNHHPLNLTPNDDGLHPALFGCHFMALPWKSLHSGVQGKLQVVKVIPHSLTSGNHTHLATATNPRANCHGDLRPSIRCRWKEKSFGKTWCAQPSLCWIIYCLLAYSRFASIAGVWDTSMSFFQVSTSIASLKSSLFPEVWSA